MKLLFHHRHIAFYIAVFSALFLSLTISPVLAQNNDNQTLSNAIKTAQQQGISEQEINGLVRRAHEKNIPDNEIAAMLQPAIGLASKKLPYDLIMQKSLEGMAKGVQPAVITRVENRLQSNTMDAAQMMDYWLNKPSIQHMLARSGKTYQGSSYRNQVLTTIAGVLFQGTPNKEIGQLLSDMAKNDVASKMNANQIPVAIQILPDLATSKNHPNISRGLILQAIKGHFAPNQIQQLPMAMARAQQMSQLPAEALAHGIGKQINDGVPAMTILQGLFDGHFPGGPSNNIPPGLNNPHHSMGPHGNGSGNNSGNGNGMGNGHGDGNGHGNGGNH